MAAHIESKVRKKMEGRLGGAEGALVSGAVLLKEGAHLEPRTACSKLASLSAERPELDLGVRLERLERAASDESGRRAYIERYGCAGVRRFSTKGDVRIY